jgi:hypothetical protein
MAKNAFDGDDNDNDRPAWPARRAGFQRGLPFGADDV